MQRKNAKIFIFLYDCKKEIYVFDAPVRGEYRTLHNGTRVGYQIVLEFLLRMCPGPSPIGDLNLKTKPKRKGIDFNSQSLFDYPSRFSKRFLMSSREWTMFSFPLMKMQP